MKKMKIFALEGERYSFFQYYAPKNHRRGGNLPPAMPKLQQRRLLGDAAGTS